MLKEILFASRNKGKILEIRSMLEGIEVQLRSLADCHDLPEIVEDGNSFLENALKKAMVVSKLTGETVLADDSGIEVEALDGAPGIRSARYAGEDANDEKNIRKLLDNLKGIPPESRGAAFTCVLVLLHPDGTYDSFEGRWEGRIAEAPAGEGGFGYDPIFLLPEWGMTVAQLSPDVKNVISHRGHAFAKFRVYLKKYFKKNGA